MSAAAGNLFLVHTKVSSAQFAVEVPSTVVDEHFRGYIRGDLDSVHFKELKPVRREIRRLLGERKEMSAADMLEELTTLGFRNEVARAGLLYLLDRGIVSSSTKSIISGPSNDREIK